jgi:GMP synthase (glutamine-hydrolysing)
MILVLDTGSFSAQQIADIVDNESDYLVIPILDLKPEHFSDAKGAIIANGSLLITGQNIQRFLDPIQKIIDANIPILGVGLGHQLLGLHFDAEASLNKPKSGLEVVESFEDSILFERLPDEIEVMKNHRETISIPPDFVLVAASDTCVNEAMQHKSKPFFGVQFLPELSGTHGAILLENFVLFCIRGAYQ